MNEVNRQSGFSELQAGRTPKGVMQQVTFPSSKVKGTGLTQGSLLNDSAGFPFRFWEVVYIGFLAQWSQKSPA